MSDMFMNGASIRPEELHTTTSDIVLQESIFGVVSYFGVVAVFNNFTLFNILAVFNIFTLFDIFAVLKHQR